MKNTLTLTILVAILAACGAEEPAHTETNVETTQDYADDEPLFLEASQKLVGQFGRDLKSELMDALNASGPAYALQICQIKAPEIAASHTHGGWKIKRVSEKYRNPSNRPDTSEVRILHWFADTSVQQDYYQDWYGDDSSRTFRFCKKIETAQMCLQCHGDLQTIDRDMYVKVKSTYPWDKATGYHVGDLRGMFVVEATWPEGKEVANLLVSGVDMTELTAPDTTATDSAPPDTAAESGPQ